MAGIYGSTVHACNGSSPAAARVAPGGSWLHDAFDVHPATYNSPRPMPILATLAGVLILAAALTRGQLDSFTYRLGDSSSVDDGKVPLVGGTWTDKEGGSTFTLHPTHAIGDLDGDGQADAVAILVESSGGTGSFYYMFALLNRDGQPAQAGEPEWLGDRTVIERLAIDRKGVITLRYITHRDNDPSCCPTMKIEDRFRVQDGKLVGITK
jgi:hypothetical protein